MPYEVKPIADLVPGDKDQYGSVLISNTPIEGGKWHVLRFDSYVGPVVFKNDGGGLTVEVPDPPHPAVQALDEIEAMLLARFGPPPACNPSSVSLTRDIRAKYGV